MAETCKVCGTGPYRNLSWHEKGAKHRAMLKVAVKEATVANEKPSGLDADLQAIVDAKEKTPQERGKMTRAAFESRGWPNDEHPGTVREFMEDHDIPCLYASARQA